MKYRKTLKILVLTGILYFLVQGLSEFQNQVSVILLILLYALILVVEYYLFKRNRIPQSSEFNLDFGVLRKNTDVEKKSLPVKLNSLIVAEGEIPDWIVVGGGASQVFPISFTSFQVVYDDKTVIIECPFDNILYEKFCRFSVLGIRGRYHSEENFNVMQKAMLETKYIIATHEHWDHVGGIAQSPYVDELLKKTVLTVEQVHGHTIKDAGFPEDSFEKYEALKYDRYQVLSPGIVLIKAPGHSVGSQMIYVRLRNGEEFLFIGDVAWNMINIEKLTNHSKMGMILRYENGELLGHQIRWLYDNVYDNPDETIHLVTSHDLDQIEDYRRTGLIGETFE